MHIMKSITAGVAVVVLFVCVGLGIHIGEQLVLFKFPPDGIGYTDKADIKTTAVSPNSEQLMIELNSASAADIEQLEGIGEKIAVLIVEYREANGGIKDIDELINVKGIGEKKLEQIKKNAYIK